MSFKLYSSAVLCQLFVLILLMIYCSLPAVKQTKKSTLDTIYQSDQNGNPNLKQTFHIPKTVQSDNGPNPNHIVIENRKKGTRVWWTNQTNDEPLLEGFTTQFSHTINERVSFKIAIQTHLFNSSSIQSLKALKTIQLWIFRLGYYDSLGATLVTNISYSLKASIQPNCLFDLSSLMVDCDNWHESVTWVVPSDAVSG
jgi:hypothetical protein